MSNHTPITLTIPLQPYTPFWHVEHRTMRPTEERTCADCAGSGTTLSGNMCKYCFGKKVVSAKLPEVRDWFAMESEYKTIIIDGDGFFYQREDYCCGSTDYTDFYPANCFATKEEAEAEIVKRRAAQVETK